MVRYIIPGLRSLSWDKKAFPLLDDGSGGVYVHGAVRYPLTVQLADNTLHPLLVGGLVTEQEVDRIAAETARAIMQDHAGEKILLLVVLEGALAFARRIISTLGENDSRYRLAYTVAPVKVSSYTDGSRAGEHLVVAPLSDDRGEEIRTLGEYHAVIILDDLIDSGRTFAWLARDYLPRFSPCMIKACFMLEKVRPRDPEVEAVLRGTGLLIGVRVEDVWVVGYGPDITLPGKEELRPLHLCRGELPGGVYGFNSTIEQQLIRLYHADPDFLIEQLGPYITEK